MAVRLLDSRGNILDNQQWNITATMLRLIYGEPIFFTQEGYGYVNLNWDTMLVLRTPSGTEVMAPDGFEFSGEVLQYQDDWAFVRIGSKEKPGDLSGVVPVDSDGNFYSDIYYHDVCLLQSGNFCGKTYYSTEQWGQLADLTLFTVTEP